jgi:hypothetical protein
MFLAPSLPHARALERNPEAAAAIREAGWDVALNRIIAHPGRAYGLAQALDWLASHPKVWIVRRGDMAAHWRKWHPPPGTA